MTAIALQFVFPSGLTPEKFIAKLGKESTIEVVSQQFCLKTYYDSFDWRLYNGGIVCEFEHSRTASRLTLSCLDDTTVLAIEAIEQVPKFAEQFSSAKVIKLLQPLLKMRALQTVTTLEHEVYKLNVLNKNQKTVVRLKIESFAHIPGRVIIQPVKGYDKVALKISEQLLSISLKTGKKPVFFQALKVQGRKPGDYSSKCSIQLKPEMSVAQAAKHIYTDLLQAIKANEHGAIDDIDSEFLHDFRVAVRRTRAGLSQIKGVLPEQDAAKFTRFFAWLGQVTGPTRDMDVYLLNFSDYKSSLPIAIREDLNPLHEFLVKKQKSMQRKLVKQLKTEKYQKTLLEWERYLKPMGHASQRLAPGSVLPIKTLADRRIWRIYKSVLKEGCAISDQSAAEALHDLRKTCKKLRYLMEFFQNLYEPMAIKSLIKTLKGFQEVLGDFQDYEVQENALREFSAEMMLQQMPTLTFLAMGVLIQDLDGRSRKARSEFSGRFAVFNKQQHREAFKVLFVSGKD